MPLLEVRNLSVRHGGIRAVEAADFAIEAGEVVVLIGANGAGKSSLLRALLGLCPSSSEVMRFDGSDLNDLDTRQRLALGLSLVPETRALFPGMTVEDNLKLGLFLRKAEGGFAEAWKRAANLFPALKNRLLQRAGTLSGGEQQMVAIARALMQQPRLLCLDEPSLGLGPKIVDALYGALDELKRQGVSLLLVEQQARRALDFGTRGYVLNVGKIVRSGLCTELAADKYVANAYLAPKSMNSKHPQYEAVADIYDRAWGDDRGSTDISAYTRLASQTNGPILEMGAGTGRVCIELAANGHKVVGLELSPKMAAIAGCKAEERLSKPQRELLEIVVGDMCSYNPPTPFSLVILPFSVLWECGSKKHAQEALNNAYRLLASSGCLFFDCSYYGPGGRQRPAAGMHSKRRCPLEPSGALIFQERDSYDEASGLTKKWLHTDTEDELGNVIGHRTDLIQRIYLTPEELRVALTRAGFHPDACELFGAFDLRTPLEDPSFSDSTHQNYRKARQVWICKKGHP